MITTILTTTLCPGRPDDTRHSWHIDPRDGRARCEYCDDCAASSIVQIIVPVTYR